MATERLPMHGVGVDTVSDVVRAAAAAGLEWAQVAALGEAELEAALLEAALYGSPRRALRTPLPDPAAMDVELKKPGVTLQLLHVEYRERHPTGTTTPVLRPLPALEAHPGGRHTPGAPCRREAVHRLRGPEAALDRPRDG